MEQICPKCGNKLMIEMREDGKCSICEARYFWDIVCNLHWHRH